MVQGVLSVHGSPGWVCKGSVPGAESPKPGLKHLQGSLAWLFKQKGWNYSPELWLRALGLSPF